MQEQSWNTSSGEKQAQRHRRKEQAHILPLWDLCLLWPFPFKCGAVLIGNHWNVLSCVTCCQDWIKSSCTSSLRSSRWGDASWAPCMCHCAHLCVSKTLSVELTPGLWNTIPRYCALICQFWLLLCLCLKSKGFQLKGCVLGLLTCSRPCLIKCCFLAGPGTSHCSDGAAHVSKTRRIWLSVNYDSWHLKWNKDQIWDGFLPSCCI